MVTVPVAQASLPAILMILYHTNPAISLSMAGTQSFRAPAKRFYSQEEIASSPFVLLAMTNEPLSRSLLPSKA